MHEHHYEQSRKNRCVVACARMVLSRIGQMVDEDTLCQGVVGSKRGFELEHAANWIGGKYHSLDLDDPRNYEYLRFLLGDERWIIVLVFGLEFGKYVESLSNPLQTKWSPLSQDLGLHAVTLIGNDQAAFLCLDPYHDASGQPFGIPINIFATFWTGQCAISPRLA